jgi:hypothetical protein
MNWSRTPPAARGYYWHRLSPAHPSRIVEVMGGRAFFHEFAGAPRVESLGGEWAGPIPEPAEPVKEPETYRLVAEVIEVRHGDWRKTPQVRGTTAVP